MDSQPHSYVHFDNDRYGFYANALCTMYIYQHNKIYYLLTNFVSKTEIGQKKKKFI